MRILFLGTGAADFPLEKCENFRRTSSALIDDTFLIDPGPWALDAINEFKVDIKKIKYVLVTHYHDDHFNEDTLKFLENQGAKLLTIQCGSEIEIDGYKIMSLKGNHTIPVCHFIFEKDSKRLFYGLDGAWLQFEEIDAIWTRGVDLAVFDATIGFVEGDWRVFEHNSLNMVLEMKKSINKAIKKYVISHMAYTLHTDHSSLEKAMKKHHITVAYDGLTLEV